MNTVNIENQIDLPKSGVVPAPASETFAQKVLASKYLHIVLLLVLVAVCFGRTLSSYFLADDFGEVSYVSRIFNGEPGLFWSNFTGNYMQIPGMNVYRPYLLVTLVADYLLYKANSIGYYSTNLLYFAGDVLLIYAVGRQLTQPWSKFRSGAAAFFGAALFAASPLRCESVSWVVGRVDITCCFFYLLSFWFVLKSREVRPRLFTVLSILSFLTALGTKEMAIGLPVLVAATEFFGIGFSAGKRSFVQRIKDAALRSAPLWAATLAYFIVRFACLGTLGGGYVGGFGASQLSFMVQRWFDPDTITRLFYPFCLSLFSKPTIYSQSLHICYVLLFSLAVVRLVQDRLSPRWFLFLSAWIATCAVPIFQLWGLGFNLEGSRFYFFLSIPLCLMAPILLFRPKKDMEWDAQESRVLIFSSIALCATILTLAKVTCLTDLEWVHAGKENRQVSLQSQKLAQTESAQRIVVLGIPKERNGAHQILNGSTFNTMLDPPFVSPALSDRFITFDPIMFGPSEFINATRLHEALASTSVAGPFVWTSANNKFAKLTMDASQRPVGKVDMPVPQLSRGWLPYTNDHAVYEIKDNTISMTQIKEGDAISLGGLDLNPLCADFLEFEYLARAVPVGATFTVSATGDLGTPASAGTAHAKDAESSVASADMTDAAKWQTVRVRLSRYWRWFCLGNIRQLAVQPYPCSKVAMRNFKLLSADLLAPTISVSSATEHGTGITRTKADNVTVSLSARKIKGASAFAVEIGKVNYFFNNLEKIKDASPVANTVRVALAKPTQQLDPAQFTTPGFYELRARCLDAAGDPIGEYSDQVTVKILP